MKKITALFCLCFAYSIADAQDPLRILPNEIFRNVKKEIDTSTWHWKRGGLVNANLAQGSLSNWAAGGDDFSMAIGTYVNYYLLHRNGRYTWDNNVDFNFGFIQASSVGSRKNDDRIDVLSKYGFSVDSMSKWYLSGLFNFRSQFFDGNNYNGEERTLSSSFLSPAYILLSAGMDYKPSPKFSMFLSPFTSRWVVVTKDYLSKQGAYGVPAGKHSINELGAFASLNYKTNIIKNVTYKGKLDMFSNYKYKPGNIDFYFTNYFAFKINKTLSATYALDMIYDDDVKIFGPNKDGARLQLRSMIGIGFLMQLSPKKV